MLTISNMYKTNAIFFRIIIYKQKKFHKIKIKQKDGIYFDVINFFVNKCII